MSQITLRQIPDNLDKQLRSMAGKKKTSLNKLIISLLLKGQGLSSISDKQRNLADLAGTWSKKEYDEFQINTEIFSKIDPEIWK